jgi:cytoskeletal protein RodZ
MEPLGKKLQEARLRKKISIEEASRVTKIRAARLQEIENEDFSSFSSLAYAKGFLLIYGKYLDVDVSPYLDAFETSREVSVDGYSYLQEAPEKPPLPLVRRQAPRRATLLPLIIAIGVLVIGLYLVKLLLDIQRITPHGSAPNVTPAASATPSPSPTPEKIVAPRALPVEETPVSEASVAATPSMAPSPAAVATPAGAAPGATEPEVRRALPVHPERLTSPAPANSPPPAPGAVANQVQITPVRLTYVRVSLDGSPRPVFDDWLAPTHPPLVFRGSHFTMKVLDRGAVDIMKNGVALAQDDVDVTFE